MASASPPQHRRIRPLEAWCGMRALVRDPDDTPAVFRVIRALGGRHFERLLARVRRDPTGRRILAEGRSLLPVLADRKALRGLPEGTLGREYARFMDAESISADGLVEASERGRDDAIDESLGPEAEVLSQRLRDMHDLWHVVTGYGRDIVGETALLGFTYAQTRSRGIGFLVGVGMWNLWKGGARDAVAEIRAGYRRGRRAALLPAADWEALLRQPLVEVRRELGVEPVSAYPALRSAGAPSPGRTA